MRIQFSKNNNEAKQSDPGSQSRNLQPSYDTHLAQRRILYSDKHILVAVKPAGILSQPGKNDSSDFLSYLRTVSPRTFSSGEDPKLVHRLDRPVGGILLFTRSRQAERFYSPDGVKKNMKKTYIAIVNKKMPEQSGILTDFLVFDGRTNLSHIVANEQPGAAEAILRYEVLREILSDDEPDVMQVLGIELLTGRHHQIRVQLANAGCPIIGDTKYNPRFSGKPGWHSIALFADSLSLRHPAGRQENFYADPAFYEPDTFFLLGQQIQENKETKK